jgi:hypothetical protein
MDIDARVIKPALNPTLNALSKFPATRNIRNRFSEIDAACVNDRNHQPDAGSQMA